MAQERQENKLRTNNRGISFLKGSGENLVIVLFNFRQLPCQIMAKPGAAGDAFFQRSPEILTKKNTKQANTHYITALTYIHIHIFLTSIDNLLIIECNGHFSSLQLTSA